MLKINMNTSTIFSGHYDCDSTHLPRYRHEYKYLINCIQENLLLIKASSIMELDSHVSENGMYKIRSLYFDDENDSCLLENYNGTDPRSKFRIRYYNNDRNHLVLEKKSKKKGMCLKESCVITQEECKEFIEGNENLVDNNMSEQKKKLFCEIQTRKLRPKVIVTYERVPFVYLAGNVRVTFDKNISSSNDLSLFLTGNYCERPIMPLGYSILEVKWDEVIPKHIKDVLLLEELRWIAFSKYSMCRRYHL